MNLTVKHWRIEKDAAIIAALVTKNAEPVSAEDLSNAPDASRLQTVTDSPKSPASAVQEVTVDELLKETDNHEWVFNTVSMMDALGMKIIRSKT